MNKILGAALIASTLPLVACQSVNSDHHQAAKTAKTSPAVAQVNNDDLYEVAHQGRYYVFDDFEVYQDFLNNGETPYRKVFIGEGPQKQTLVFGLRSQDKKKSSGIASIDMFRGQQTAANNFYGELRDEEGRLYVFSELKDMVAVRSTGEAAYRFTQIGAGPKGETVVFVLNKSNKKKKPMALISAFSKRHMAHNAR